MCCTSDILLGVLAIIFPPIAVWIKSGLCTIDSLINILLCMLGYIPGLLHAWYIIAKYPEDENTYEQAYGGGGDLENRHVTYYYVNDSRNNSNAGLGAGAPQQQRYPNPNRGYGTVQGMMGSSPQPQPQPQQPQSKPPQGYQQQQQGQGQRQGAGGEGSSQVPPSYEQAVAGDNKVQS
ncbi:hypothetical protein XANCAGTX0491_005186 [Xanthoria calcicola]